MKKLIAFAVLAIASHAVLASAGEAVASSKEVAAPPPPPPPTSYFRSNEFSLGLFGSYSASFNNNSRAIGNHAWGGGIDGEYFPLRYLGFAVEGNFFNEIPGDFFGSTVIGNVILRYPLDIIFPGFHLAPYAFGGVGGIFNQNNTFTRIATVGNAHRLNRRDTDDEVLGDAGVGLEYRFTPHIGLFSDARYNFVNGPKNNFLSTRFGIRYAF
jgi:Outer membrane protein beta-barrel domain